MKKKVILNSILLFEILPLLCISAISALLIMQPVTGICSDVSVRPRMSVGYTTKAFGGDADFKDIAVALATWIRETGEREGFRTESYLYQDIDALMRDYQKGKFDTVFMESIDYFSTIKKPPDVFALSRIRQGETHTRYVLVVGDGISSNEMHNFKGKSLSIVRQNSLGMAFMDMLLLKKKLPEARQFLREIQEKGKESQAILAVFFGQADVCITTEMAFKTAVELNPQVGKKLRVIATSPELIETVSFFSNTINIHYKEKIINSVKNLSNYPRGKQILLIFNTDSIAMLTKEQLKSTQKFVEEYLALKGRR